MRPWLLLGLAAFVVVLVISVGLVALWALEQRVQSAETRRMSVMVDAMASILSLRSARGSATMSHGDDHSLVESRAVLRGFISLPGVLEVALTAGDRGLVMGGAGIEPLGKDVRATSLRTGLVARRDSVKGGLLLFYRRVPLAGQTAVLRVAVDRDKLLVSLLGETRRAFWGLAAIEAVMVIILAGLVLTRTVTGPLGRLERAAKAVALGDFDREIQPEGRGEIRRLFDAFAVMTTHLRQNRAVMEDQIRRLSEQARSLEAKQAELDASWQHVIRAEKFATVGRLAAGVAHEVGNPLTALLGYVEIMRDPSMDWDSAQEFLVRMERELRRMDGIIRGLLDYSRRSPEGVEKVSLAETVNRATELLSAQKRFRNVQVDMSVPDDFWVAGSENSVVQVLLNLLTNAADAMQAEGRIWVRPRRAGTDQVELWVCDEGPGIPENLRESIFDPFFTTKDVGDGTGLGLAVSRSLMEAMNGRLDVATPADSPLGDQVGGACFRLVFQSWKTTDPRPVE